MALQAFNLPTPPPLPADNSYPLWRNWLMTHADRLYNYVIGYQGELNKQFNTLLNGQGKDIASASTITVSNAFHQITGTTPIDNIQQPQGQSAVGTLTLYAKDGVSTTGNGNVPQLSIGTGQSAMLSFSPALNQWTAVGNAPLLSGQGPDLPLAPTITVTNMIHFVTAGTGPLTTIARDPSIGDDVGTLYLIANPTFSFLAQAAGVGNIQKGGTAASLTPKGFIWVPSQSLWYPL